MALPAGLTPLPGPSTNGGGLPPGLTPIDPPAGSQGTANALPPGLTPISKAPPAVTPKPQVDPTISAAVDAAVKAHPGVSRELLLAIGEHETGLGTSSVYDPVTGLSKTKGNQGHGIWQLDPASGASQADLDRAAHDPFFAADRAAQMLEGNIKQHGVQGGVAAYNAGSPASPVGQNYAQQVLANVEKWNPFRPHGPVDTFVRQTATMAHDAAQNTVGALDAVLGAPQRFVEGAITSHGDLGHGAYVATHPRDEALQDRELKTMMSDLHLPEIKGDTWASKIGRFAEQFAAQTGTDPTLLIPVLGEIKMAGRGIKIGDAVVDAIKSVGGNAMHIEAVNKAATKVTHSAVADSVRQMDKLRKEAFGIRPELDPWLSKEGKDARLSVEQSHRATEGRQAMLDGRILKQYEPELRAAQTYADLPEAIKVRQLMEPWLHGTPEMRTEAEAEAKRIGIPDLAGAAEKYGVVDPGELARLQAKPSGLLSYGVRKEYVTLLTPGAKWGDQEILKFAGGKHKQEFSGFEKRRNLTNQAVPTDMHDLMENRFRLGRARVRQQATDDETGNLLEAHPEWNKTGGDPDAVTSQLSHAPKSFAPDSPLRGAGRAYKFAISLNPFPHFLKNVGTLAYLWGGPEAFGKGIGHAFTGLSDEQRQRLVTMGADPGYVHDIASTLEKIPGLGQLGRASETIGNRLELGYRQALIDQLDRKLGPSTRTVNGSEEVDRTMELQKAAIIRHVLGDYRNAALFTSVLEAFGGPFVIFRTSIVPRAVGKAVLRRPGYVESIARGQEDVNAKSGPMGGKPSEFDLGGPVEDFTRMGLPSFYTSPATIGPASYAIWAADPTQHKTLGGIADRATGFLPFGSAVEAAGGLAPLVGGYGAPGGVSPGMSALSSVLGSYFRFRPSAKAEEKWKRAENLAP